MCTVSFVPLKNGCILTSNRDESPDRSTIPPQNIELTREISVEAPVDTEKGGTWIAIDKRTLRIACLLNGARVKHRRNPPYRKSRGRIVLEAFKAPSFVNYANDIDLEGIEPFTLILASSNHLLELIWNGNSKEIVEKDINKAHIWSSSTLYSTEAHLQKQRIFYNYLKNKEHNPHNLLVLHGLTGNKDFILEKEQVKTVSITQVVRKASNINIRYYDHRVFAKLESLKS